MDDRVGTTLGHYRIKAKLGQGGMGAVYLAEDETLDREVALKLLPPEVAADPERLERFEREARSVAALNHPNIVTLHSIEEEDGVRFITMERVSGQTLAALIPEPGLPLPRFFELAIALADALAAAHARGITHRDLKPENVMVDGDGRLKILDFGLAKVGPAAGGPTEDSALRTASVTQDGRIVGTISYMSPEQAQGLPLDHRSDIFSLGILLYEMATGERPFKGANNMSVLSAILKDVPPPVTELKQDLPRSLARMIQRTLEKDVKQRYQSAADLRQDLQDLRRDVETGEVSLSGLSQPGLPPLRRRAMPWKWLAVGAAAVAWAVGWAALGGGGSAPPAPVAPSDGRPLLAVFYFDNLSGDPSLDWLRTGLTDMLVTDLTQSPELRVLDSARLYQILDDLGRLDGQTTSFEVVQEVARRARVTTAVVGSFVKAGETIRISARVQDATSGEVIASERVEGQGEDSILSLVDTLTARIRDRFDGAARGGGGGGRASLDRDVKDVTTSSLKAYKEYVEGIRLHEELRETEAVPHFQKAVEIDPEFAMAWAKLSVSLGNLGRRDEAREHAKRALDLVDHLSPRERYYIEGRYYSFDPREAERAMAAYQKAVDEFDHVSARNNLAQALIGMGRYEEAITHLETLRERGMTFPGTFASLADSYAAVGDYEKGYDVLREYTEINRENAAGWINLAQHLIAWGRYDDAEQALRTAEELDPNGGEADVQRFYTACLQEDWSAAEAALARLPQAQKPTSRWQAYTGRALLAGLRGTRAETLAAFDAAIADETLPAWARAQTRFIKASALLAMGDHARALALADQLVARPPDPYSAVFAIFYRALTLATAGDAPAADAAFARYEAGIAELPPGVLGYREPAIRGFFDLARGRRDAGIAALERAASQIPKGGTDPDPTRAQVWYRLGEAHLDAGRPDEAARWLDRVVTSGLTRMFTPYEFVRSLERLGRIHAARGDAASARRYYSRYVDYWGDGDFDPEGVADARRWLASQDAVASR